MRAGSGRRAVAGAVTAGHRGDREGLNEDVVAGSAVEDVDPWAADQHVVACSAGEGVVAGAADQDVVAVAAIGGEQHAVSVRMPR